MDVVVKTMDPLISTAKESQISFQYSPSQNSSGGNSSQRHTHARSSSQEHSRHSIHRHNDPNLYGSPDRTASHANTREKGKGIPTSASSSARNSGSVVHTRSYDDDNNAARASSTHQGERKRARTSSSSDDHSHSKNRGNGKGRKIEDDHKDSNVRKMTTDLRGRSRQQRSCCCSMREILEHDEFSMVNVIGFVHSARSMNYKTTTRQIIDREKNPQAPDNAFCIDFVPLHQPGSAIIVILWHDHSICNKPTMDYLKECQMYDKGSEPCLHATQLCRTFSKNGFQLIQLAEMQLRYSPVYECWTLQSASNSQVKPANSAGVTNETATSDSSGHTYSFSALSTQRPSHKGLSQLHEEDHQDDSVVVPQRSVTDLAKVIGIEAVGRDGTSVKSFVDHTIKDLPSSAKRWANLLQEYIRNCCACCLRMMEEDTAGGWICPSRCNVPKRNSLREWKTDGIERIEFETWMKQCDRAIPESSAPKEALRHPKFSNAIVYVQLLRQGFPTCLPLLAPGTIIREIMGGSRAHALLKSLKSAAFGETSMRENAISSIKHMLSEPSLGSSSSSNNSSSSSTERGNIFKVEIEYTITATGQGKWLLNDLIPQVYHARNSTESCR